MTAAIYAARKAAGLCTVSYCHRQSTHGVLCKKHRLKQRETERKIFKQTYHSKKLAGICTGKGCTNPPRPDSFVCDGCSLAIRNRRLKRSKTAAFRTRHRIAQASFRAERRRKGLCTRCNRKLATKNLCQVHREEALQQWRERTGREPNTRERCGLCGEHGHRAPSCHGLAPLPPLRIEEFASARHSEAAA